VSERLSVMESFVAVRETTNPYQTQLVAALRRHVNVRLFSWRAALSGDFDVLHVHWPEVLIRDRNLSRTSARRVLLLLVLIRLRLGGRALVRTLHNVAPHDPGHPVEGRLLRLIDRWTTHWIALNEFTPRPSGAATTVIPHGHYKDWFADQATPPSEAGRLLYFGRLRRYKGVEELIAAFRATADPALRLRIVGGPDDGQFGELIGDAVRADSRISAVLRHATDAETAAEFARAELVVLPYREMHNSGSVLLALSLDRPVIVPGNEVTRALAREVGSAWILGYDGAFDSARLTAAIEACRANPPVGSPDLSRRNWGDIGQAHATAFEHAASAARSRRRKGLARFARPRPDCQN
jgi:beta-1,4-mannosyltransferase